MINALKLVSVRRGYDPRDFAHDRLRRRRRACTPPRWRSELRVGSGPHPAAPGHFSAWGMLMTDPMQDFIRTALTPATEEQRERIAAIFGEMESEARQFLRRRRLRRRTRDDRALRRHALPRAGAHRAVPFPADTSISRR